MNEQEQYIRKANLVLANEEGAGLDLSEMRIDFVIQKTDGQTPNIASIRVFNLNIDTMNLIREEFTDVLLQAGYESNFGVIFAGSSKKIIYGEENNTTSYLEIQASDGDGAYNFSVINTTISAGASQRDQVDKVLKAMEAKGVTEGSIELDDSQKLPRGKVMYGMSRDYLRQSTASAGASWSIQDGQMQVIPLTGVLPDEAVVLNSQTGLIGRPQQTDTGIKFRCLLNPQIKVGGSVHIAEADIQEAQLETDKDGKEKELASIETDGFYRVIALTLIGSNRGQDWYCEGTCLDIDVTTDKSNSVQAN